MLEDEGHPSRRPQVLVRYDPNGQLEEKLREQSLQARRASRERHLTNADSEPCTHGGEIRSVAVSPYGEVLPLEGESSGSERGKERRVPVLPDEGVPSQKVGDRPGDRAVR
jgi:hypothetical protein